MSDLTTLGASAFVSLTTFRRNGTPVATPMWVVPDAEDPGRLLIWTVGSTGKVKRLRHTPRARLQPCGRRGDLTPGTGPTDVLIEIREDAAALGAVTAGLAAKYGLQYRLITLAESVVASLRGRFGSTQRAPRAPRVALVVTADT